MLSTKTPKATVGGLSPSKGYTLQIFELTGSGNVLLAQREFVSESAVLHWDPGAGRVHSGLALNPGLGSPGTPACLLGPGDPRSPGRALVGGCACRPLTPLGFCSHLGSGALTAPRICS